MDLLVRLVWGVDAAAPGPGGSVVARVLAGEFGAFDGEPTPDALEEHFAARDDLPFQVLAATDPYSEQSTGAVAGVPLAEVWNRDTPRNLSKGLTRAELESRIAAADAALRGAGIRGARLWFVQSSG